MTDVTPASLRAYRADVREANAKSVWVRATGRSTSYEAPMAERERSELGEHVVRELRVAFGASIRHLGIEPQGVEVERGRSDETEVKIEVKGGAEASRNRWIELYSTRLPVYAASCGAVKRA